MYTAAAIILLSVSYSVYMYAPMVYWRLHAAHTETESIGEGGTDPNRMPGDAGITRTVP